MPQVLQPTPASRRARQGKVGSIRTECWLFYVSSEQLQAFKPKEFLNIRSDDHPEPGIGYRLEQFVPVEEESTSCLGL